jgi:hypothetical protein
MSTFVYTELTQSPETMQVESACLGVDADNGFDENDIGKCIKFGDDNNVVLAGDGDDIEGFLVSISPETYNDGFAFGSVQRRGRKLVQVEAGEAGTFAVGDEAVSGITVALNTDGLPQVVKAVGTVFKWRCIRLVTGTGVAGDTILIERA